jgi:ABC-type branched-subunit amino acid transport system substrate-binding protein
MKNSVILLLFLASFSSAFLADPIDRIAVLLRQGQANELVKQFAASVELSILNDEKVVSKAQAETMLNAFFTANKPVSAKVIHRVNTNPNLHFAVAQLRTSGGNFRISYSLKNTNGNPELTELRIEAEKAP